MKNLLFIISTLFSQILFAQGSLHYKQLVYKITLNTTSNNKSINGYLSSLTDTSVGISSYAVKLGSYPGNQSRSIETPFYDIDMLSIKRPGATGRGVLIGGIAGALTGVLAGFASGDDHPSPNEWFCLCLTASQKARALGVAGGITGSLIGGIVGALAHTTFTINSKKEKFDEFKWSLTH